MSLLVILCYQTGVASDFLDRILPMLRRAEADLRTIDLAVLTPEQTVEVAADLMGQDAADPEVLKVSRVAQGNPGHLRTLIRQQVDLSHRAGPDDVELNEVIVAQIHQLTGPPLRLLTVLTVAGGPLPTEHAIAAADLADEAFATITTLRAHELISVAGLEGADTLDIAGDRLRQYLDDHLEDELRTYAHGAVAKILEVTGDFDPHQLVNHWLGAGDEKKASLVAWLSAERAMKQGDFRRGAPLLALALQFGHWSIRERQSMLLQLGYANAMIGRGLQAAGFYGEAVASAPKSRVGHIETRQAEQLLSAGYLDQGTAILDRLLKAVGQHPTSGGLFRGQMERWRRFKLWRRGLAFDGRQNVEVDADAVAKVDLCWTTVNVIELADPLRAMANQSGHLLVALDVGENEGVLKAMATELYHQALAEPTGAWLEMHDRGMEIAKAQSSHAGMGRLTVAAGRANFEAGNFVEAARQCTEGDAILAHHGVGVAWERFRALYCAARAHLRMGDFRAAASIGGPLLQQSAAAENILFQADLLATVQAWLHVADGRSSAGLSRLNDVLSRWPQEGFALQHARALLGQAFLLRAGSRPDEAWSLMQKEWAALERSGLLAIPSVRADAWLALARTGLAWGAEGDSKALGEAEKALGMLSKDGQAWVQPWIALCEAGIQTVQGQDPGDALQRARAGFHGAGLRLGHGLVELRAGRSGEDALATTYGDIGALAASLAPGRW